jgi:hypothetical protein
MKPSKEDLKVWRIDLNDPIECDLMLNRTNMETLIDLVEEQQALVEKILWHEETLGGTPTYILDLAKKIKL